jgi:hypothetical protein
MQKKLKIKHLFIFLLICFSCTKNSTENIDFSEWNKKIEKTIRENNAEFYQDKKIHNELIFILNQRKRIVDLINNKLNEIDNNDLIVVEDYNCMYDQRNQTNVEIPISKNKYYLILTIYVKNKNFYYYCHEFSENEFKIEKKPCDLDDFNLNDFEGNNFDKEHYLLNDFILKTYLKLKNNKYDFQKINYRLN